MKAQVGQYRFGRHRNMWGIWLYTAVNESGTCAKFVKDSFTYGDFYKLNP